MTSLDMLAHPLAQRLTLVLAHFLWQGAAIFVLAKVIEALAGMRRAQSRYVFYCFALLLTVLCPLMTFGLLSNHSVETTAPFTPAARFEGASAVGESNITAFPRNNDAADRFSFGESSSSTTSLLATAQPWLLAAWLIGVMAMGLRLLISLAGVYWLQQQKQAVSAVLRENVALLSQRLKMRRVVRVFSSHRVREAVVAGFVRPVVLLPAAWLLELPPAALEALIAHELAHVRRLDLWVNLLQRLVETLLFYHPAVWLLSRRIRLEREMCCDELAVAAIGRRDLYVDVLKQIAERRISTPQPALSAAIRGGDSMTLLKRVRYLLDAAAPPRRVNWPAGMVVLAGPAALLAVVVSLSAPGQSQEREERDAPRETESRESDEAREDARRDRETRRDGDPPVERDGDRERGGDRPAVERERDRERTDGERRNRRYSFDDLVEVDYREIQRTLRDRDGDRERERGPQDAPNEQLMRLILELKNEISSLRQELRAMRGERERDERDTIRGVRERDSAFRRDSEVRGARAPRERDWPALDTVREERRRSDREDVDNRRDSEDRRRSEADDDEPRSDRDRDEEEEIETPGNLEDRPRDAADEDEARADNRTGRVQGVVTKIGANELVEVSVGADDGMRLQQRFAVTRNHRLLGQIELVGILEDRSMGRIISSNSDERILPGDWIIDREVDPTAAAEPDIETERE